MDGSTRNGWDSENTNMSKNYEGKEVEEGHDHSSLNEKRRVRMFESYRTY